MVATLTRRLGSRHLAIAEDAVQDALMTALQQRPFRGVPDQPEAWLFQVAKNRALDRLRHTRMASDKAPAAAAGRRRPARIDPAGLPPVAPRGRAGGACAQTGRRLQCWRDRARLSRPGHHDCAAPGARQARTSRLRRRLRHACAGRARCTPPAFRRVSTLTGPCSCFAIRIAASGTEGDLDRAAACYHVALGLARSTPEQNWLASRLAL